ncbi:MAG: hypothetical protein WC615_01290 [Mucilaginibacter sp.]|jgi:hypothetical protein|uniref:hypothetical protein n=1 Tax=Mucilaginibacter sp. TaxID=1882438 RepID=UPI003568C45D
MESSIITWTLSDYCQIIGDEAAAGAPALLFSYLSKRSHSLTSGERKLIQDGKLDKLAAGLKGSLIEKGILTRDKEAQMRSVVNECRSFDKITVVCTGEARPADVRAWHEFIVKYDATSASFLFLDDELPAVRNKAALAEQELQALQPQYTRNFFNIRYDRQQDRLLVYGIKPENDFQAVPVHTQWLVQQAGREGEFEAGVNWGISCYDYEREFANKYFGRLNFLKDVRTSSLVNSKFRWFKELPFPGLIIDQDQANTEPLLHPQCLSCALLPSCGGYTRNQEVVCPTFKATAFDMIPVYVRHLHLFEVPEEHKSFGLRNKLAVKKEVDELLLKLVCANTDDVTRFDMEHLISEYDRGFRLSRSGQKHLSQQVVSAADQLLGHYYDKPFELAYLKTCSTSAQSYLAYRKRLFAESDAIISEGLDFATQLLEYKEAEIAYLILFQMLSNRAKVFLVRKNYGDWIKESLNALHFLLNAAQPDEVPPVDFSCFSRIDGNVVNAFVLEMLGNVTMMLIKDPSFQPGYELLGKITIDRPLTDFKLQLSSWVSLSNAVMENNHAYIRANLKDFLMIKNASSDIRPLQLYLKTIVKKQCPDLLNKLKTNTDEANFFTTYSPNERTPTC